MMCYMICTGLPSARPSPCMRPIAQLLQVVHPSPDFGHGAGVRGHPHEMVHLRCGGPPVPYSPSNAAWCQAARQPAVQSSLLRLHPTRCNWLCTSCSAVAVCVCAQREFMARLAQQHLTGTVPASSRPACVTLTAGMCDPDSAVAASALHQQAAIRQLGGESVESSPQQGCVSRLDVSMSWLLDLFLDVSMQHASAQPCMPPQDVPTQVLQSRVLGRPAPALKAGESMF